MRTLFIICVILLIVVGVFVSYALPSYSWHQKMTITVEADGEIYSGSSVVRIRWRKNDPLGSVNGPEWVTTVQGEAPFVEVPGVGILFALLNPPDQFNYAADLALRAFADGLPSSQVIDRIRALQSEPGRSVALSRDLLPFFVAFANIDNPKSVREVNPLNMAEDFGSGVSLKSVTLEITGASTTKSKIKNAIPWINSDQVLKNPTWRGLPRLSQRSILELKKPVGE